jgi:very-short-patch-repair endonuclease
MLSRDAEAIVAAEGRSRRGIVRACAVLAVGVTSDDLDRLRDRGVLESLGRGLDRLRDRPFDWESRCQATLDLAGDGAVLGLRSAGRMHGAYAYRDTDAVEVLIARGRDHRSSVGRIVQTRVLPPSQIACIDGFPVTTMARTFFDLCGDPDPGVRYQHPYHERRMRQVYNDALGRRGMTFFEEAAVLAVTARRGRRGTTLARNTLLHYGPKHEPTRSHVETLFLELVRAYDLPEPERQVVMADAYGFIGTVDFLWPRARHVVEVDSSWHDGPEDELRDLERDEALRAAGYTVDRYRYGDIVRRPTAVARELGAATRRHADQLPPVAGGPTGGSMVSWRR